MSNEKPGRDRPLVLYFGAAQALQFYAGLLGSDVALGLLHDSESVHRLAPEEFALIERMPFSAGVGAICQRIEEIRRSYRLESILNVDETLVPIWSEVCARLGLPAISPDAAAAVRSKSEMRRRFAERIGAHVSARFRVVTDEADALRFADEVGYPVVIKPGNLWGSYFVSRCADAESLARSFREISARLPEFSRQQRVYRTPVEVLVEEYLPGTNHSVECLVLDGRVWTTPVIDVVTGADLGNDDFHHFARVTATRLTAAEQSEMYALAAEAVRALGVDRGIMHVEFVRGQRGIRLIEAAGRPGANRPPMLRDAFGINLIAGYRDVMRGVEPMVEPTRHGAAAVVTPYPKTAGILRDYRGLDQIKALASTRYIEVYKRPGELVQPRRQGTNSLLRIELQADTPEQLWVDLHTVTGLCADLFDVVAPDDPASPAPGGLPHHDHGAATASAG